MSEEELRRVRSIGEGRRWRVEADGCRTEAAGELPAGEATVAALPCRRAGPRIEPSRRSCGRARCVWCGASTPEIRREVWGPRGAEHLAARKVGGCTRKRCGAGCWPKGCGTGATGARPPASGGERRAHLGELVPLDGSYHAWFEERGPKGCLMNMVE